MSQSRKTTIAAGLLGTVAFDLSGLALTGKFWDVPQLLASKLHAPLVAGVALHYSLGVILAVLYVALAPQIPGGRWTKPLLYITAQVVFGVYLFMMPLLGAGALGLGLGAAFPFISMARHWLFAAVLGAFSLGSTASLNSANEAFGR